MSKKKITRSMRYGYDEEVDIYISAQTKPRYIIYKTGERASFYTKLDELREFVRKHKSSLMPLYAWEGDYMVEIDHPEVNEAPTEKPQARKFKALPKASTPRMRQTITVVVNGTELTVPLGSKVEFVN